MDTGNLILKPYLVNELLAGTNLLSNRIKQGKIPIGSTGKGDTWKSSTSAHIQNLDFFILIKKLVH